MSVNQPGFSRRLELRELCKMPNYFSCIREERNLVAIIYHLLLTLTRDELQLFLEKLKVDKTEFPIGPEADENGGFGIYYDYSFLRDLWSSIGSVKPTRDQVKMQDRTRRNVVKKLLKKETWDALELEQINDAHQFNLVFNPNLKKGKKTTLIHCPSSWRIDEDEGREESEQDRELVIIKKAFNAKPDLVIHTSSDRAVCFEFKCESGAGNEGGYHQLGIQKRIFELLGIQSKMFFVTRNGSSNIPKKPKKSKASTSKLSKPEDVEHLKWGCVVKELCEFEKCQRTLQRPFVKSMFKVANVDDCDFHAS